MIHFHHDGDFALEEIVDNKTEEVRVRDLVLYNDDVNTFDFVIQCLIVVCKHDALQAEQCTYIVHYNGKCTVKTGSYLQLNPMRQALLDRGLSAVID